MKSIAKYLFILTASIGLFSCSNSNSIKAEKVWDTYIDGEEAIEKAYQGVSLKEYEGVTFKLGYTESTDDSVVYLNAFSFYIADFNNDGYRDFCLGVSFGSGYIDDRISIYDYHNQVTLYSIDDRFNHNYYFFLRSNRLCIKETNASDDKQVRAGSFYVEKGNVLVNWNEELDNVTEYYLKINDRSELIIEMPHLENKKPQVRFKEGDEVIFKTGIIYDADVVAYINGTRIKMEYATNGDYIFKFTMPNKASILQIGVEGGM